MMIHDITAAAGASRKRRRIGRGTGSGRGKTCGRGHKGSGARAGAGGRPLGEGGALPLYRRLPIRGFSNVNFTEVYQVVNVGDLEDVFADGADVNAQALVAAGLIGSAKGKVKILGNGTVSRKLTITAERFSASARQKIAAAGGTVNETCPPAKKFVPRPAPVPAEPDKGKKQGKAKKQAPADAGDEQAQAEKPKKEKAKKAKQETQEE